MGSPFPQHQVTLGTTSAPDSGLDSNAARLSVGLSKAFMSDYSTWRAGSQFPSAWQGGRATSDGCARARQRAAAANTQRPTTIRWPDRNPCSMAGSTCSKLASRAPRPPILRPHSAPRCHHPNFRCDNPKFRCAHAKNRCTALKFRCFATNPRCSHAKNRCIPHQIRCTRQQTRCANPNFRCFHLSARCANPNSRCATPVFLEPAHHPGRNRQKL